MQDLCEYELLREENIRKNKAFMLSLGLQELGQRVGGQDAPAAGGATGFQPVRRRVPQTPAPASHPMSLRERTTPINYAEKDPAPPRAKNPGAKRARDEFDSEPEESVDGRDSDFESEWESEWDNEPHPDLNYNAGYTSLKQVYDEDPEKQAQGMRMAHLKVAKNDDDWHRLFNKQSRERRLQRKQLLDGWAARKAAKEARRAAREARRAARLAAKNGEPLALELEEEPEPEEEEDDWRPAPPAPTNRGGGGRGGGVGGGGARAITFAVPTGGVVEIVPGINPKNRRAHPVFAKAPTGPKPAGGYVHSHRATTTTTRLLFISNFYPRARVLVFPPPRRLTVPALAARRLCEMGCARSHDLWNTPLWRRKVLNGVEVICCVACRTTVENHVKFPRGGVTVCALCPATETSEFRVVKGTGIVCNPCRCKLRNKKNRDAGIKCVECKQLNRSDLRAVKGEAGAHICNACWITKRTKELNDARTKCVRCGKGGKSAWTACPDGFCCATCYKKELSAAKKQKK